MKTQLFRSRRLALLAVMFVALCAAFITACGSSNEEKGTISLNIGNLQPVVEEAAKSGAVTADGTYINKVVADFYEAKDGEKSGTNPTFSQTKSVAENQSVVTFDNIACKTYYLVANMYVEGVTEPICSPSYVVTVKANTSVSADCPNATEMSVTIEPFLLKVGNTSNCEAVITLVDGTDIDGNLLVEWSSSDPSVASLKVNETSGTVTLTGLKEGQTTVKATYNFGLSGVAERSELVTVSSAEEPEISGLEVSVTPHEIAVGEKATCKATLKYVNGDTKDVTADVEWINKNPNICSDVDENDHTVTGLADGLSDITASYECEQGTYEDTSYVKVGSAT